MSVFFFDDHFGLYWVILELVTLKNEETIEDKLGLGRTVLK